MQEPGCARACIRVSTATEHCPRQGRRLALALTNRLNVRSQIIVTLFLEDSQLPPTKEEVEETLPVLSLAPCECEL